MYYPSFENANIPVVVWDAKYKTPEEVPAIAVWDIGEGDACFSKDKLRCFVFYDDTSMDCFKRTSKFSSYWVPVGCKKDKVNCRLKILNQTL